jgi:UDP-glucose 4-epimerase
MAFERVVRGEAPLIFGDDYETPDGTCVRDYIHVADLAEAHTASLDLLAESAPGNTVFNVGTGVGTSVREILSRVLAVTGSPLEPVVVGRRPGDPAYVVASSERITTALGWRASRGVDDMITSAWAAFQTRVPAGN